jgi:RHS repeat-associated protein
MHQISSRVSRYTVLSCIYLLSLSLLVGNVQAGGSASTLPGQAPGAPVGSFPISGIDTVNLFNGHLNFRLPLLEIAGRGQASFSLGLPIDHRWQLRPTSQETPDTFNPVFLSFTSLTPGFLRARHLSEGCQAFSETQTHTILVFTTPTGSEVEFRDGIYLGQPALSQCNPFDPGAGMANRGRTFTNDDGTFTFISDSNIFDMTTATNQIETKPSGYLLMKDGTRFRVTDGQIKWLRDRNGNLLTFTYESSIGRLTRITDSLNREINISYTNFEPNPFNTTITYKGFGGATRTITIEVAQLSQLLVEGTTATYSGLFGIGSNEEFNPWLVKLVRLPDNRTFQLRYNKYGELSRVELPTGGVFTYEWASGNPQNPNGIAGKFVDRRVIKKSVYKDAVTLVGSTSFGLFETDTSGTSGSAKIRQLDEFNSPITDERHYFHGIPIDNTNYAFGYTAPAITGREYQADINIATGATLLRRVEHTYDAAGINIVQTLTTLADVSPNLISKQTFTYDQFNNLTNRYEYDFGSGAPGAFLRRSHIDYVTNSIYTGTDLMAVYAGTAAHLRSLPLQQWVSADLGGSNKTSLFTVEYDNYTADTLHAGLLPRANITGLCTTFDATGTCSNSNATSYTKRGNATTMTSYANAAATTGAITVALQYDIAGNLVKAIDARGFATEFGFADCYGSPDANAQNCSGAAELGAQISYAFPTSSTNTLNHISRGQFDYYLGKAVDTEDPNAVVTSVHYDDPLDRTRKIIQAANQDTRSQTIIEYDDASRTITSKRDLNTFNDQAIVRKALYDGLGRTIETRQYESATNYIVTKIEYDPLSRPFKVSNPFRPWQSESPVWTTKVFDALGRPVSVTTPDNAQVSFAYSGDRTLVADQNPVAQNRRKRISSTNAAGQLTNVWEVTTADSATEPLSFPGYGDVTAGYRTSYEYDTLNNLKKVLQGSQERNFAYDSLKRLTSETTPESGTVSYQYDQAGNLSVKTDARGASTHFDYDPLNRLTRRWYNGSSDVGAIVQNTPALPTGVALPDEAKLYYDSQSLPIGAPTFSRGFSVGQLVAQIYGTATAGDYYGYDSRGRPSIKIQQTGNVNYQIGRNYNLVDQVTSQIYPSTHTVTYNYDSAGRLADKDAQNLAFTGTLGDGVPRTYSRGISYASAGQLHEEQFGTSTPVYQKLRYNSRQQLSEILASSIGGDSSWNRGKIINQYSLQCSGAGCNATDNNGILRRQEVYIPMDEQVSGFTSWYQHYDYDELNRLKRVQEYTPSLSWQQEYVYDRWGNRKIHQTNTWGDNIPKPNFGVNTTNNRLTAPSGYTMNYDAAGNLTTDTYTGAGFRDYDAENRMIQAWGGDNQWQYYSYDADGRRTRRRINGQETWQIYGFEGELLAEYAANGAINAPQREYGYRHGELLVTADPVGNPTLPIFADDFNDNSLDLSKWTVTSPGGTPAVTEEAQQLRMSLAPNTAGYNGVYSSSTYNLTGNTVQVEVVQAVSQAGWCENMMELELNANNYFLIDVGAGNLLMRSRVNGVNDQTIIAYDSVNHRHWRIRHDSAANTINFETSADSIVWITRKTVTPVFSLASLRIYLIAGAYGTGNSVPGSARYDNLKLLSSIGGPSSITVPNSGFETPSLGFGNFQYGSTGGSWNFINGAGISAGGSGFTGGSYVPQGSQVAFVQSNGEFSQSLSGFQANINYVITFFAAQRTNCCNPGGQQFAVYLDGTLLGTFNPPLNGAYVEYSTASFTTTAGAHTVKFVGLNPGGQAGFIDHVRITGSPVIGNGVQWFVADQLGTPRMIFDQTGSLVNVKRHDYLPFGEELNAAQGLRGAQLGYVSDDSVRQQFTAYERDTETELDYAQARYFSNNSGRFASPDPYIIFFAMNGGRTAQERQRILQTYISEPRNWNRYAYCVNDPVNLIDPSGLIWLTKDDANYRWVDDDKYRKEDWQGYREAQEGTIAFFGEGWGGYEDKYKHLLGKYVTLKADGTLGDAGVQPSSDPNEEERIVAGANTFMQMTRYYSTVLPDVAPAYVQLEVDAPGPPIAAGPAFAFTLDRNGNFYTSSGVYGGTPGFNMSLGWLTPNSSAEDIEGFLTGHSAGGSVISKYGVGGGVTRASGRWSPQVMGGTPGASASYLYTRKQRNFGVGW